VEPDRRLAAILTGLIAGTGRRGLTADEAHILLKMYVRAKGLGVEWGREEVEKTLDWLYDRGVLTLRFERERNEPFYTIVEPDAVDWIPAMPEFLDALDYSEKLFHGRHLTGKELRMLAYLSGVVEEHGLPRDEAAEAAVSLMIKGLVPREKIKEKLGLSDEEIDELAEELEVIIEAMGSGGEKTEA